MGVQGSNDVAFTRPGGEMCSRTNKSLPINLAHLAQQTMDDRELEREILTLFSQQADTARRRLSEVGGTERKRIAHGLKGAAQAVGAFAVAECAELIIDQPENEKNLLKLAVLVEDVRNFVASVMR